jgi:hypothetical protein
MTRHGTQPLPFPVTRPVLPRSARYPYLSDDLPAQQLCAHVGHSAVRQPILEADIQHYLIALLLLGGAIFRFDQEVWTGLSETDHYG